MLPWLRRSALLFVLLGAAACSSPPAATPPAPQPAPPQGRDTGHAGHGPVNDPTAAVVLFAVQSGPLGVVATDGGGRLLYRSDGDSATPPTSNCVGDCARTWAPLTIAPAQELELAGVRQDLVGRLQRPDGTSQVTLGGWPLYVRPDDDGQLRGPGAHGAEGRWWAVRPSGEKAAAP